MKTLTLIALLVAGCSTPQPPAAVTQRPGDGVLLIRDLEQQGRIEHRTVTNDNLHWKE
jgi:hypothetical protein